jgi:type II secretory pathway pseudopilin PulG
MAQTIWSAIAVVGGVALIAVILWALATGRNDREEEEAARRYFDEHGRWPDEAPN